MTSPTQAVELLPCPFCGSEKIQLAGRDKAFWLCCKGCGMDTKNFDAEAEAIAAWNRRAPVSQEAPQPAERAAAPFKLVYITSPKFEGWANLIYTGPEWEGGPVAMCQPYVTEALRKLLAAPVAQEGANKGCEQMAAIEREAKLIYSHYNGAESHPWIEGGNSLMQDKARREARITLAADQQASAQEGGAI